MNDTRLRTALRQLGEVPPPPDLAGSALDRARRDRRRTVTGLVVAVTLLAAGAVTVPALVLHRPAPSVSGAATPGPAAGPAALVVTAYTSSTTSGVYYNPGRSTPMVYSRAHGGYSTLRSRVVAPSPDGRLLAVTDARPGPNGPIPGRIGILAADRADDPAAVRWVPGTGTSDTFGWLGWTSDSTRLLYYDAARPQLPHMQYQLLDVRTLQARTITLTTGKSELATALPVVPPGRAFALNVLSEPHAHATMVVRYFDDRGARTGEVALAGAGRFALGVDQPFSPDGRLIGLSGNGRLDGRSDNGTSSDIVDARSGRIVRGNVRGHFVRWYGDDRFVVATDQTVRVVELATGRVLAEKKVARAGEHLAGVWLAPLTGAVPPGAVVI
jgi:hypothetical protein